MTLAFIIWYCCVVAWVARREVWPPAAPATLPLDRIENDLAGYRDQAVAYRARGGAA